MNTRTEPTSTARETIAAVASPPGRALRAVVRVSGPGSRAAAERLLALREPARGVHRVRVRHAALGGEVPGIASWMPEGRSFTGEDSLEVSCVGSPFVAEALVDALVDAARGAGFAARRARGGEFAMRAHLAGRLSIDAAEGIAARIAATNDAELAAADEVARGAYGERAAELVARTAELLALVEAGIDFTDQEDVVAIDAKALAARAESLARETSALRGGDAGAGGRAVPTIVLAGAPNAGKSALFNALVGRARVVSSALRGTTRDAIRARLALGGAIEAELVDIAGLDEIARDSAHGEPREASHDPGARFAADMQRQAERWLARADVVVRCTPVGERPLALATTAPLVEVVTMSDLVTANDELAAMHGRAPDEGAHAERHGSTSSVAAAHATPIATSARTGEGVERLREALREAVRADHALRGAQLASILPRHAESLAAAAAALDEAAAHARRATRSALDAPEVVASLLRGALDALGEVAAPVHPDEVLGLVFSRFCIGK